MSESLTGRLYLLSQHLKAGINSQCWAAMNDARYIVKELIKASRELNGALALAEQDVKDSEARRINEQKQSNAIIEQLQRSEAFETRRAHQAHATIDELERQIAEWTRRDVEARAAYTKLWEHRNTLQADLIKEQQQRKLDQDHILALSQQLEERDISGMINVQTLNSTAEEWVAKSVELTATEVPAVEYEFCIIHSRENVNNITGGAYKLMFENRQKGWEVDSVRVKLDKENPTYVAAYGVLKRIKK